MTVFGIGTMEIILILLLLILIFGPDRITEMGRWLGQAYGKLTGVTTEINQQVAQVKRVMNTTLDVPDLTKPIREATAEIGSLQKDITRQMSAPVAEPAATAAPQEEKKEQQA